LDISESEEKSDVKSEQKETNDPDIQRRLDAVENFYVSDMIC
jgi:hypothetical protein